MFLNKLACDDTARSRDVTASRSSASSDAGRCARPRQTCDMDIRWLKAPRARRPRRPSLRPNGVHRSIPVRIENGSTLQRGLAIRDPRRGRVTLEIVPEPLQDAPLVIDLILLLRQPVSLAGIHQQHDVLSGAS